MVVHFSLSITNQTSRWLPCLLRGLSCRLLAHALWMILHARVVEFEGLQFIRDFAFISELYWCCGLTTSLRTPSLGAPARKVFGKALCVSCLEVNTFSRTPMRWQAASFRKSTSPVSAILAMHLLRRCSSGSPCWVWRGRQPRRLPSSLT